MPHFEDHFPISRRQETYTHILRDRASKFFARPGTASAEMHYTVEPAEIKRRSSKAAKLAKQVALERNKRWVGWTGEVFVDERGKVAGSWISRNSAYKPVTVQSGENLLGKTLRVKVEEAFQTHLAATKQ